MRDGATLGAEEAARAAELLGRRVELLVEELADAGDAAVVARLARATGAGALLGGLAAEDSTALSGAAASLGVPFLNLGYSGEGLRGERCAEETFHVAPSLAMCLDAALLWIAKREDGARWRLALPPAEEGELLRRHGRARLVAGGRAGAALGEAVFGPALPDAPMIALDPDGAVAAGGEGVLPAARVLPWHHTLSRYGAEQLNDRFQARFGHAMPPAAWAAWMAVKIAWETAAGPRAGAPPRARLAAPAVRFDGHKGRPLDFRPWDHQLRQPLYVVEQAGGDDAALYTAPPDANGEAARVALDRLGLAREESACRLSPG